MNAKHISVSLVLVLCSVVLVGQKGITEGSTIVLNKGKLLESQRDIIPKIKIIFPELDGQKSCHTTNQRINIAGQIDNFESIEYLVINNNSMASLDDNGVFEDSIYLQPGIQEIKITAQFNDTRIEDSFTIEYITPRMEFARQAIKESKYHALIIGVNEYSDRHFSTLDRPVKDANRIYQVLITKYAFESDNTTLLENPTKRKIERELDEITKKVKSNDNLLIFFAGHGLWNEVSDVGYWIPTDAEYGSISTYFSNSQLVTHIKEIQAKDYLVIADACFAGAMFNSRSVIKDSDKEIQEKFRLPSCKAMTSESFKEADDKSAFAKYLIEELYENDEVAIAAVKLYSKLYQPVKDNGGDPRYGTIKIGRDRGGEFIFIRKQIDNLH